MPSCDLNLVLSALQKASFELIRDIPLDDLFFRFLAAFYLCQTCPLVALSYKEPFLRLHKDKDVLRPRPSFLDKVVSVFSINGIIVLSSGPCMWHPASEPIIPRRIRNLFTRAYAPEEKSPPGLLHAHTTRSLTFEYRASIAHLVLC